MSWLWGASTNPQYEELVEKACSPLKLPYPQGEDIADNLEITDMIRSKAVQPKPAMQSLKSRVQSPNGRVQMYALSLIDTCIKNGGDHFLAEIASKEFVDAMTGVIRLSTTNAEVKQMALQMFQQWALAFKSRKDLSFLVDVYNDLKNSGVKFPPPPVTGTSSTMLDTATAPQWVDSDVCMRCRTAFTFTNRKHHCRNCGLVFDQACSSKVMPIPKFGIKEDVRVCDGCWIKAGKNKPAPAVPGRTPRSRQDYDADLQRAIELSLQAQPGSNGYTPSEPPLAYKSHAADDDDEQMRLAIEASLREMEKARPSAPAGVEEPEIRALPTFDLSARETETILTFSNTLDQMAAYGERDLRRFPQAHILHDQAYALGGKLQRNSEEKTTKQQMLFEMQSKLGEAVALYGQILDGQQAYAARKAQEAQHQQYAQYQQPYGYQSYSQYAPPQANGAYQQYAPPPQQYAPPQQHAGPPQPQHAPSMYPNMPAQSYNPQQAYAHMSPAGYTGYPAAWQQQQAQPTTSRQGSYNATSQASAPYQEQQQHYTEPQQQQYPQQAVPEPHLPNAAQPIPDASAPPPVDLASHPSMSPRSVTSVLPPMSPSQSRATSYAAPSATSAPSAPPRTASYTSAAANAPPESPLDIASPAAVNPPAQGVNPWESAQPAQQQQQAYTPAMFPPVFPSAPEGGFEQPQQQRAQPAHEEALLIEL